MADNKDTRAVVNKILAYVKQFTIATTSGITGLSFKRDSVDTAVSQDTSTPGNTVPLPVISIDSSGNSIALWERFTDVANLVTASNIGAVDGAWVDQGAEIDCRGYKTIALYVSYTDNNSTGGELQFLSKHTSAGADEYKLEVAADYQKSLPADDTIAYFISTDGTPYIQVQTRASTVGATAGTITIDVIKEY